MFRALYVLKAPFAVSVLLLLMSCISENREGSDYVPSDLYEMDISYDRQEKAFLFRLVSHADRDICVPRMRWPSEKGGHYFFGDEQVYFADKDVRYNIKDLASGYCTPTKKHGCVYTLGQNEELVGKLPIEDFIVPPEVYLNRDFDPRLHYPYDPRFCE